MILFRMCVWIRWMLLLWLVTGVLIIKNIIDLFSKLMTTYLCRFFRLISNKKGCFLFSYYQDTHLKKNKWKKDLPEKSTFHGNNVKMVKSAEDKKRQEIEIINPGSRRWQIKTIPYKHLYMVICYRFISR